MAANECSIEGVGRCGADEAAQDKTRRERWRALILPREHGAWGLLLAPMVTGAGVAFHESNHLLPVLLLLVAALALFWLRTPVESLLGTSAMRAQTTDERRVVGALIAGLGAVAALALGALLWKWQNPLLWLIGAAAVAAFIGQALLKLAWRQPPRLSSQGEARRSSSKQLAQRIRMLSEIVGTIGLTASGPATYYVITGKFGATAWMLWLANLIFAGNQIHYVQLRIHTARIEGRRAKFARGWTFAVGQLVMAVLLAAACAHGMMPWIALIAFVPLLFRGWFYFLQSPKPLQVRRLGWNELSQAAAFCILFIAAFALAR
ncbi:MAG: YwiC-like family protein [Candidatus Sulfotelmatobacter sp.]